MNLEYKILTSETVDHISMIDRSEVIDHVYYFRNGALELEPEHYNMKDFPQGEREKIIERQKKILTHGGSVIGCYDGNRLVGIVSVENLLRGTQKNYVKMDILHISAAYRKNGISSELIRRASDIARSFGAKKLYISATPSQNTIDFYLHKGCRFVEELDEELYALEPDDIHLELVL